MYQAPKDLLSLAQVKGKRSGQEAWERGSEPDPFSQLKLVDVYLKLSDKNRACLAF